MMHTQCSLLSTTTVTTTTTTTSTTSPTTTTTTTTYQSIGGLLILITHIITTGESHSFLPNTLKWQDDTHVHFTEWDGDTQLALLLL